jgi:hypothetical protein
METFFLACFVFGALFTLVSVLLGAASHAPGADVGHFGHLGHGGHAGHAGHLGHGAPAGQHLPANGAVGNGQHGGYATQRTFAGTLILPLLNPRLPHLVRRRRLLAAALRRLVAADCFAAGAARRLRGGHAHRAVPA